MNRPALQGTRGAVRPALAGDVRPRANTGLPPAPVRWSSASGVLVPLIAFRSSNGPDPLLADPWLDKQYSGKERQNQFAVPRASTLRSVFGDVHLLEHLPVVVLQHLDLGFQERPEPGAVDGGLLLQLLHLQGDGARFRQRLVDDAVGVLLRF